MWKPLIEHLYLAILAMPQSTLHQKAWSGLYSARTSKRRPTYPTLRANPFPQVTDLICRLPLETWCGYGYGQGCECAFPSAFQGQGVHELIMRAACSGQLGTTKNETTGLPGGICPLVEQVRITQAGLQWIVMLGLLSALTVPGFGGVICTQFITSAACNPACLQCLWQPGMSLVVGPRPRASLRRVEVVANHTPPAWILT